MEALVINEVRQRKKKSEERKNLSNDEGEKEIPDGGKSKEITPPDIERGKDKPPNDDLCPICFGNYNIACMTNCGHWFCANCLITFWSHSNKLRPCNCPICTQSIKKLTPMASLNLSTDNEVVEALRKVQGYNRLFEASIRGFILRQRQLSVFSWGILHKIPWLLRMLYIGLWDHDNITHNFIIAKFMAMFVTLSYLYLGFNFLPVEGYVMTQFFFQLFTVLPVLLLAALSVYRRFVATGRLPGPTFDGPVPPLSWRFFNQHILLLMRTIYMSMWNPNNLFINYHLTTSIATLLALAYDSLGFDFPGGFSGVEIFFQMFTVGPMFVLNIIGIHRGYHLHHAPRGMLANLLPGP
ncbi:hypothetical protein Vadar_006159 [Vaccinium darrowii]|uniref:Uncharacterized protein n=1 Tax=Vaccinium darrowii TaxID=229202 RepID=A0ACB7XYK6_9ERIC|nr:hypothetical protein Vadar_006159 [Vaccinium darrowii]